MKQEEDEDYKGPKEDCVEECKFHYTHWVTALCRKLASLPTRDPLNHRY